jgi:choline dehydrogenase
MEPLDMLGHLISLTLNRKGPFGAPAVQAMALAHTREGLDEPDVQLHFMLLVFDIDPDTHSSAGAKMSKEPAVTISANVAHPRRRGRVTLGRDRRPRIVHQLIGDSRDVDTLVGAMKLIEKLFKTSAFSKLATGDSVRPDHSPPMPNGWISFVPRR